MLHFQPSGIVKHKSCMPLTKVLYSSLFLRGSKKCPWTSSHPSDHMVDVTSVDGLS